MKIISDKIVEKTQTHIICSVTVSPLKHCAIYQIMWKSVVELDRPQRTI